MLHGPASCARLQMMQQACNGSASRFPRPSRDALFRQPAAGDAAIYASYADSHHHSSVLPDKTCFKTDLLADSEFL